ncbi:hypothetical protein BCR44DRAFT_1503128 [Catenaria anguillulae PL171]|uniref:Uncharacterized protein n=1 Tax=Catenaria anguillulae PL171 TaxID=765915 RepID=A0A1Y2HBL3_9FUNG|nr:hypothetical protein BCR44DRAFT_1503128 [Catenaria anguillulae PL171]
MSGRGGRGRGAYYKAKYGGGASRKRVQDSEDAPSRSDRPRPGSPTSAMAAADGAAGDQWGEFVPIPNPAASSSDLVQLLNSLDRQQYGAYKQLYDLTYRFPAFSLRFLHIQGDAYAPPSSIEIKVPHSIAQFPAALYSSAIRKLALADFLNRHLATNLLATNRTRAAAGWAGPKGGSFSILQPSSYVLERSPLTVTSTHIEARFYLGLPAQGRSIMGHECANLVGTVLPQVVDASLLACALDARAVQRHVECVEDQEALRTTIAQSKQYVGFIANGSILPRASGVTDAPLASARPWQSPPSWQISLTLPNHGTITGTAIPRGITLITGGGFHGKSTVMSALAVGMLNKIPGDGREFVVLDPRTMAVQSQDGRSVDAVDISPFIGHLPGQPANASTCFSTTNASGSTSLAAHVQEAREVGVKCLLLDEDTCATNFMVRDERMRMLVGKGEPITPFTQRIRAMVRDEGMSVLVVVGASGDYLRLADQVLGMVEYEPQDWTQRAKAIASGDELLADSDQEQVAPEPIARELVSVPATGKVRITHATRAELGEGLGEWDTGPCPSLVEQGMMRYMVDALAWIANQRQRSGPIPVKQLAKLLATTDMKEVARRWEGEHVRPRAEDVIAALNRLRSAQFRQAD